MRWPWQDWRPRQISAPATNEAEASQAEAAVAHWEADRELEKVRAQRPAVEQLAARITHELAINHFQEAIIASMQRRGRHA